MHSAKELTELKTSTDFTHESCSSWWTDTHWCLIHATGASITRPSVQTLYILRALDYKI